MEKNLNAIISFPYFDGQQISFLPYPTVNPMTVLAQSHEAYFDLDERVILIDANKLAASRARPKGIANANRLMAQAARNLCPRRGPITVRLVGEDQYCIVDGNSTFLVGLFSGWKDFPCIVETQNEAK